jgi:membrane fusion protein, multidrug efflux system
LGEWNRNYLESREWAMSKVFKVVFFLLLALAVVAGLYYLQQNQPLRKRLVQQSEMPVTVAAVKQRTVTDKVEAIGTARANESVTLTANVTEHVRKFHFEDGQFVKKDQILVELTSFAESAQLADAAAKLHEAKRQYERVVGLAKKNYVTKELLDRRIAQWKSMQAMVKQMEAKLKDRLIRAPFSGVLGFRKVSVGTLVEPGTEIATLDDIDIIKLDFSIPEKYLADIKEGQTIIASSIAYPDKHFKGTIKTIGSRVDEASRSVVIRALINNSKRLLRPGMLLTVDIQFKERDALFIPESALVPLQNRQYVFVVGKDNKVKRVEITIGKREFGQVEVLQGLKKGEKVVVDGGFKLKDGMTVQVTS